MPGHFCSCASCNVKFLASWGSVPQQGTAVSERSVTPIATSCAAAAASRAPMSVRRISVRGRAVWQARVSLRGLRRSRLAGSCREAREHEAELVQVLRREAHDIDIGCGQPATLRKAFAHYESDLEARGK